VVVVVVVKEMSHPPIYRIMLKFVAATYHQQSLNFFPVSVVFLVTKSNLKNVSHPSRHRKLALSFSRLFRHYNYVAALPVALFSQYIISIWIPYLPRKKG